MWHKSYHFNYFKGELLSSIKFITVFCNYQHHLPPEILHLPQNESPDP